MEGGWGSATIPGVTGPQGVQGVTGPQGPTGEKGDVGATGPIQTANIYNTNGVLSGNRVIFKQHSGVYSYLSEPRDGDTISYHYYQLPINYLNNKLLDCYFCFH